MRPRDVVAKPGFSVPNLTKRQQTQMGLPADFWEAFDQFFEPANVEGERRLLADRLGVEVEKIEPVFELELEVHSCSCQDEDSFCWRVGEQGGDVMLGLSEYGFDVAVTTIRLAGELTDAARRIKQAPNDKRVLLRDIIDGKKPVWSFLIPSKRQDEAFRAAERRWFCEGNDLAYRALRLEDNAGGIDFVGMSSTEIEEHFAALGLPDDLVQTHAADAECKARDFSNAGGVQALSSIRSEIDEIEREMKQARYELGWPGPNPPKMEQA